MAFRLSKTSGKEQRLEGAYVRSNNFKVMNDYAKGKLAENNKKIELHIAYSLITVVLLQMMS